MSQQQTKWQAPLYYKNWQAYYRALDNYEECCGTEREIDLEDRNTWHMSSCPKREYKGCMWCGYYRDPVREKRCSCDSCFP